MKSLKIHPPLPLHIPLQWQQVAVKANFHGAFVPPFYKDLLFFAIEQIPQEIYQDVKIVISSHGYFILLFTAEMPLQITPYPLKRSCSNPFVFHCADIGAIPYFPLRLKKTNELPEILIAIVISGKIEWFGFSLAATLDISDFLKISLPVVRVSITTKEKALKPLQDFPTFQPVPLPKLKNMEEQQKRDLQKAKDPKPSFWARLFRKDANPNWEEFKNNDKENFTTQMRTGIRSFWNWVDSKIENDSPAEKTGFIRQLLDPDQWQWLKKPGWLVNTLNRQASMFERLAQEFERGNLETALKHSIPIDNELANTMEQKGWLSTGWQLPENILDYSLDILSRPLGLGGIAALGENLISKLSLHYQKAAEELCGRGEYRKAAYVYSFLLKDYSRAAEVLEQGGYYLDAAALYREKLRNNLLAAKVLERGGYTVEAAQLYLEEKEYEAAIKAYENAGMQEQAQESIEKWVVYLSENHQWIKAGDVLWQRLFDIKGAQDKYYQELEKEQKIGLASSRLVHLKEVAMGNGLKEFKSHQNFLKTKTPKNQIDFYYHMRQWMEDSELGEDFVNKVYYECKKNLFPTIQKASLEKDSKVVESGITEVSQILTNINDPLALHDLRQEISKVGQKDYAPTKIYEKKDTVFVKQLSDSQIIYGKDQRWGILDPQTHVSKNIKMPFEISSLVVHEAAELKEGILMGLIDKEKRFIWACLKNETIMPMAETQMQGIINAVPIGFSKDFLANTQQGEVVCLMKNHMGYIDIVPIEVSHRLKFSIMVYWSTSSAVMGMVEHGDFHIFSPNYSFSETQGQQIEIQYRGSLATNVKKVDFVAIYDNLAFFYGQGPAFGFVNWHQENPSYAKLSGVLEHDVTSLGICGRNKEGNLVVAIGYQNGEIVFAAIENAAQKESHAFACYKTVVKTSLKEIVGIEVKDQLLFAIDSSFHFVVVDWAKLLLVANAKKLQ